MTDRGDGDGRISEEEELVDARDNDGPHETDDPSAERRRGHRGIVGVGHRGPDFWIWRFIFELDGTGVDIGIVKVIEDVALRASR